MQVFRFVDERKGKGFVVVNVHMDQGSEDARRGGSKVILERAKELHETTSLPVFLTGDFNAAPGHVAHGTLVGPHGFKDSWEECEAIRLQAHSDEACYSNDFSSTVHAYLGPIVNAPYARMAQYPGIVRTNNIQLTIGCSVYRSRSRPSSILEPVSH